MDEHFPETQINFAPTPAFRNTFGAKEADKEMEKFVVPTWAANLRPTATPPSPVREVEQTNPLLTQQDRDLRSTGILWIGCAVFVLIAGGLILWKAGALSGATSTSP